MAWAVLAVLVAILVALATAWASLALWYRFPASDVARGFAAVLFALFGVFTIVALLGSWRHKAILTFAALLAPVEYDQARRGRRQPTSGDRLQATAIC
ncbi:hypothetical protein FHT77_003363 [Rhizobium sp. BK181]|nr:hypothetical protein [Rhizobium sp. BK181]MBB3317474.1 hypothetical protein [Rhizobium sp. BK181]